LNIHNVIAINTRPGDALNKRQKSYAVIEGIADIFRDNVPLFAPVVSYGTHRLYGMYEFEKRRSQIRRSHSLSRYVAPLDRHPSTV
jgi:hypothetical protein